MRLEVGLKLKKLPSEIAAMPLGDFVLVAQHLITKGEEQKKALEKSRRK